MGGMNELEKALRSASLPPGDAGAAAAAGPAARARRGRGAPRGGVRLGRVAVRRPARGGHAARAAAPVLRPDAATTPCSSRSRRRSRRGCSRRPARLDPVRRQLDEYFEGRRQKFDLKLDWRLTRGLLPEDPARDGAGPLRRARHLQADGRGGGQPARRARRGQRARLEPDPDRRARATGSSGPAARWAATAAQLGPYIAGPEVKRRLLELEGALDEDGRPRV